MPHATRQGSEPGDVWLDGVDAAGRPRIAVTGRLDEATGAKLTALCDAVLACSAVGVALDLTGIVGASRDGAAAVVRCFTAGRDGSGGVEIAVANSAGRRLLLDALDDV